MVASRRYWAMVMVAVMAGAAGSLRGAEPSRPGGSFPVGVMAVKGPVEVDRVAAPGATAVFAGDTVETGEGGAAVVKFRSGRATAALAGKGEVELPGEQELKLRAGELTVTNAGGEVTRVKVLGASVEVAGQAGSPAVARIRAEGARAEVWTERGQVEVQDGRGVVRVEPGKVAYLDMRPLPKGLERRAVAAKPSGAGAAPQAKTPQAGTVSGAIPAETVERQGKGPALPLKVSDAVHWQDLVKTEQTGRVRIALLDGSTLNIGARSEMRIVEHNAQTQQTQIEMTLGRMRGQVVKLTKPGSSFQVKTQTAVIGVVGTIFVVVATPTQTQVFCIEGMVAVRNINPSVQGSVNVGPNQSTTVGVGAPPTVPVAVAPAEMQVELSDTDVGAAPQAPATAGPTQPGGTGGAGGAAAPGAGGTGGAGGAGGAGGVAGGAVGGTAAGGGLFSSASAVAGVAAGAASAVAGVAAVTKVNDATNALNDTVSSLNTATSAANAATTTIIQSQQPVLSPAQPCGCNENP
jgi:ferric-dicitrate binding protein FerR (iron transport regulator)